MTAILATEAGINDPFDLPPASELFNFPAIALEGTPFEIDRVVLLSLLAVVCAMALFWAAFSNAKIVPSRLQSAAEAIVQFIREQIAIQVIGREGIPWVPFLTTIFMFVWFNNLLEIIPFVNFPPTSKMGFPAVLAGLVWIIFVVVGIANHGLGYFRDVLFPRGVPAALYILITPIELVSTFIVRPVTLSVRLFANMVAGHILLTMIFLAIHAFLFSGIGTPVGIVSLAAAPLLIGFEFVVGILQAYIFTILTAVYIGSSIHVEH